MVSTLVVFNLIAPFIVEEHWGYGPIFYGRVALLGDAAHSTGGASGQGCNSALQDAAALADALLETGGDVAGALERYGNERVPEGHALLDLSVGPSA